jgi:hypothetical protein
MTHSFFNAQNLAQWEENVNKPGFSMIRPANVYWYKSVLADFENRDRRFVHFNMKAIVK